MVHRYYVLCSARGYVQFGRMSALTAVIAVAWLHIIRGSRKVQGWPLKGGIALRNVRTNLAKLRRAPERAPRVRHRYSPNLRTHPPASTDRNLSSDASCRAEPIGHHKRTIMGSHNDHPLAENPANISRAGNAHAAKLHITPG